LDFTERTYLGFAGYTERQVTKRLPTSTPVRRFLREWVDSLGPPPPVPYPYVIDGPPIYSTTDQFFADGDVWIIKYWHITYTPSGLPAGNWAGFQVTLRTSCL
jgi:hypothetical protein